MLLLNVMLGMERGWCSGGLRSGTFNGLWTWLVWNRNSGRALRLAGWAWGAGLAWPESGSNRVWKVGKVRKRRAPQLHALLGGGLLQVLKNLTVILLAWA